MTSDTTMFERSLAPGGHTRRFLIEARGSDGWLVREERDHAVVRTRTYDDWHRVERARAVIQVEIATLTARGWTLDGGGASA